MRKKCVHSGEYSSVFQMQVMDSFVDGFYWCLKYFLSIYSGVVPSGLSTALTLGPVMLHCRALTKKITKLCCFEDVSRETGKLVQAERYNYLIYWGGFAAFCSWYIRNLTVFFCIKIGLILIDVSRLHISDCFIS